MAPKKNSPKSPGTTEPKRRTRRKPRPVTIDLEATEVTPPHGQADPNLTQDTGPTEQAQDTEKPQVETDDASPEPETSSGNNSSNDASAVNSGGSAPVPTNMIIRAISYCLAAIVGGVISLLVYFWFAGLGWLPGTAGPDTVRMEREISALRSDIALVSGNVDTLSGQSVGDAQSRLEVLESGSVKLADLAAMAGDVKELQSIQDGITQSLSAVETMLVVLEERANATEVALTSTSGIVEDFRQQLAGISGSSENLVDAPGLAAISERLTTLEDIIENAVGPTNTALPVSAVQIAALQSEMETIQEDVAAIQQELQVKVTALEAQFLSLQTLMQVSATDIANLSNTADDRLQAVDSALADLATLSEGGVVSQIERRAAMAISFAALGRVIDSGKRFVLELETALAFAEGATGDSPARILELKSLEPYAEKGLATAQFLTEEFGNIANAIIAAENPDQDSGYLNRAWTRIRSIVRIRPTGFVEGDSVAAIVARTENLLQSRQLAEAVTELGTLPEQPRAVAGDWIESAKARVTGNSVLAKLNAGLIANVANGGETSNGDVN